MAGTNKAKEIEKTILTAREKGILELRDVLALKLAIARAFRMDNISLRERQELLKLVEDRQEVTER